MKSVTLFLVVLFLSACSATDGIYGAGKIGYTVAKEVVKVVPLDPKTRLELDAINSAATLYDKTRSKVRKEQDKKKFVPQPLILKKDTSLNLSVGGKDA